MTKRSNERKELFIGSVGVEPGWLESMQDTFGALTSYSTNSDSMNGD
jgi:hypothetical protein